MTSFLGFEVEQYTGCFLLHLDTYEKEMLDDYKNLHKARRETQESPIQPDMVLTKDDAPETADPKEQKMYWSFTAMIRFVTNWIRYDVLLQHHDKQDSVHYIGQYCIILMGYLRHNPSFKLTYKRGNINGLDGYAGTDWGNSASSRSSTRLLARYNTSIVLCSSRLQKINALSTAEAEYMLLPRLPLR
jgi:hypothetical protein